MIIGELLVYRAITERQLHSHKRIYGRVLLIGGFYPCGGATIVSTLATVKSGVGLVTVATERDNIAALHSHLPEAMAFDCDDKELFYGSLTKADVVLIGPGLGENNKAEAAFQMVLEHISEHQILIIDGSALNLLARAKPITVKTNHPMLTPYQKEWERLSGIAISNQTIESTKAALQEFPEKTVLAVKNHQTKIIQGNQVDELTVGGPYQATGGMGGTPCGMIVGFVAQFKDNLFNSVATATYLHSYIADQLNDQAYAALPTIISAELPRIMRELSGR